MKNRKIVVAMLALCAVGVEAKSVTFENEFNDSTLRLDYKFCADSMRPAIYASGMAITPGWYGRRGELPSPLLEGNGAVTVVDKATGDTLYRNTFSSLYHEWLSLDQARESNRSFDNTFLVPQPRREAIISIDIYNNRKATIAHSQQTYKPGDYLVRRPAKAPYDTLMIHQATYPGTTIEVAILPEGYRADEMATFYDKAREVTAEILSYAPFDKYADRFNFVAVAVPSAESGVSIPKRNEWRDTAFGTHFSTFDSDRYLTTENVTQLHEALNGIPYEAIIVLANTDNYGGGGIYNSYMLTADKIPQFRPVAVHEFGHSFAGLGDEYFYENDVMDDTYPTDVEPWEPNITTLVDFDSKWKSELPKGTPVPTPIEKKDKHPFGAFEGAGYSFKGLYRPADQCRMRNNTYPTFCPACQSSIERMILHLSDGR